MFVRAEAARMPKQDKQLTSQSLLDGQKESLRGKTRRFARAHVGYHEPPLKNLTLQS